MISKIGLEDIQEYYNDIGVGKVDPCVIYNNWVEYGTLEDYKIDQHETYDPYIATPLTEEFTDDFIYYLRTKKNKTVIRLCNGHIAVLKDKSKVKEWKI